MVHAVWEGITALPASAGGRNCLRGPLVALITRSIGPCVCKALRPQMLAVKGADHALLQDTASTRPPSKVKLWGLLLTASGQLSKVWSALQDSSPALARCSQQTNLDLEGAASEHQEFCAADGAEQALPWYGTLPIGKCSAELDMKEETMETLLSYLEVTECTSTLPAWVACLQ